MSLEDYTKKVTEMVQGQAPLGKVIKFAMGDDCLTLDGTGDANTVSNEDKEADCTVRLDADVFGKLLNRELNPMTAFMTGKFKVEGDMGVAMKLQNLFS